MYGVLLIVVLIITGGAIAFIGDRLGFIGGFFIRNNHIGTGARQR